MRRVCLACRIVMIGLIYWPQFKLERLNLLLARVKTTQYLAFNYPKLAVKVDLWFPKGGVEQNLAIIISCLLPLTLTPVCLFFLIKISSEWVQNETVWSWALMGTQMAVLGYYKLGATAKFRSQLKSEIDPVIDGHQMCSLNVITVSNIFKSSLNKHWDPRKKSLDHKAYTRKNISFKLI